MVAKTKKTKACVEEWFYRGAWVKYKPHNEDPSKEHYKFGVVADAYDREVILYEDNNQDKVLKLKVLKKDIPKLFEPMDDLETPFEENPYETFRFIIGMWDVQLARTLIHDVLPLINQGASFGFKQF